MERRSFLSGSTANTNIVVQLTTKTSTITTKFDEPLSDTFPFAYHFAPTMAERRSTPTYYVDGIYRFVWFNSVCLNTFPVSILLSQIASLLALSKRKALSIIVQTRALCWDSHWDHITVIISIRSPRVRNRAYKYGCTSSQLVINTCFLLFEADNRMNESIRFDASTNVLCIHLHIFTNSNKRKIYFQAKVTCSMLTYVHVVWIVRGYSQTLKQTTWWKSWGKNNDAVSRTKSYTPVQCNKPNLCDRGCSPSKLSESGHRRNCLRARRMSFGEKVTSGKERETEIWPFVIIGTSSTGHSGLCDGLTHWALQISRYSCVT